MTCTASEQTSGGSRSYSVRTLKLLWGLSAGRCNKASCRTELIAVATEHDRTLVLGKIAHIVAHSDTGPRCDTTMSVDARNEYPNLLLLCPTCHDLVDGQSNTFTIPDLQEWKRQHEGWVRERLAREMPSVGFAELEVLARALLNAPGAPVIQFSVTDPSLKMQKNGLTQQVRHLLTMGLAKAKEVENFVVQMSDIDAEFPERLKAGFVAKYTAYRAEGLDGDGLFEAMVQFAAGGNRDLKRTATGLAVLSHLFEKCEVFEP
jgi:hypothetical protein